MAPSPQKQRSTRELLRSHQVSHLHYSVPCDDEFATVDVQPWGHGLSHRDSGAAFTSTALLTRRAEINRVRAHARASRICDGRALLMQVGLTGGVCADSPVVQYQ